MKPYFLFVLATAIIVAGCKTSIVEVDESPPFAPRGIYTETGDGLVLISWIANSESDIAGYRVYVSDEYDGEYDFIGQTPTESFTDFDAVNGLTVYYAVTAFDRSENESELSLDVAYDTPRPEGYGVVLPNYQYIPARGGYDFSTYSVGPYNDQFTDLFFEYTGGIFYLNVWTDTEIQDVGYTESLYDVGYSPSGGWSPTHDARLISGHTFVIKTWDNHYAKVRVRSISDASVEFDWAYQMQAGNTRLKGMVERSPLRAGPGFAERSE